MKALALGVLAVLSLDAQSPSALRDQLVVSPAWLAGHLKDSNLVLIHVGMGDANLYKAEHIPGAQHVPLEDFAAPMNHASMKPGELMLEMPADAALRATLQKLGITATSKIVLYFGKNEVSDVTRVILTLDRAGLGANTALLQGGFAAWKRAGQPTTAAVTKVTPSTMSALSTRPVTVDAAFVQANSGRPGIAIVDARDQSAYDGISSARTSGAQSGHIPGALSVSFKALYTDTFELKPAAELEAIFARAGVKPGDKIVGYCWIGQFATAMLFAARSLGHEVMLYDGSFEDWNARSLPLETTKRGGGSR